MQWDIRSPDKLFFPTLFLFWVAYNPLENFIPLIQTENFPFPVTHSPTSPNSLAAKLKQFRQIVSLQKNRELLSKQLLPGYYYVERTGLPYCTMRIKICMEYRSPYLFFFLLPRHFLGANNGLKQFLRMK